MKLTSIDFFAVIRWVIYIVLATSGKISWWIVLCFFVSEIKITKDFN